MRNKVLIIDDNNNDRYLLRSIVEQENFESLFAIDGLYGSSCVLSSKDELACIFLDLNMPDMNGLEFLNSFKNTEVLSQIPVHIVTGSENEPILRNLALLGVDGLVKKPVSSPQNITKIIMLLEKSRSLSRR